MPLFVIHDSAVFQFQLFSTVFLILFKERDSYEYSKAFWKRSLKYCNQVLEIDKMNSRYVCSVERLDAIDFNIIYDYTYKYREGD